MKFEIHYPLEHYNYSTTACYFVSFVNLVFKTLVHDVIYQPAYQSVVF